MPATNFPATPDTMIDFDRLPNSGYGFNSRRQERRRRFLPVPGIMIDYLTRAIASVAISMIIGNAINATIKNFFILTSISLSTALPSMRETWTREPHILIIWLIDKFILNFK